MFLQGKIYFKRRWFYPQTAGKQEAGVETGIGFWIVR
jgi:hypothetical protein